MELLFLVSMFSYLIEFSNHLLHNWYHDHYSLSAKLARNEGWFLTIKCHPAASATGCRVRRRTRNVYREEKAGDSFFTIRWRCQAAEARPVFLNHFSILRRPCLRAEIQNRIHLPRQESTAYLQSLLKAACLWKNILLNWPAWEMGCSQRWKEVWNQLENNEFFHE